MTELDPDSKTGHTRRPESKFDKPISGNTSWIQFNRSGWFCLSLSFCILMLQWSQPACRFRQILASQNYGKRFTANIGHFFLAVALQKLEMAKPPLPQLARGLANTKWALPLLPGLCPPIRSLLLPSSTISFPCCLGNTNIGKIAMESHCKESFI